MTNAHLKLAPRWLPALSMPALSLLLYFVTALGRAPMRACAVLCWVMGLALTQPTHAASLDGLAVEVANRSEPVLCAEKDNVTIAVSAPNVRSFRIEAAHPPYIGMIQRDSVEADWTACDMSADPVHKAPVPPRRQTL